MKQFETYPQVRKFQTEPLEKLTYVIQNTKRVIKCFNGLQSVAMLYLMRNLKKNEFVLVFRTNEDQTMVGYMSKDENDIIRCYEEQEELTFNDMYERG